jgi:PAS domain S-box-containing protein
MVSQSPNVELRLRAAVESSPSGLLMIDGAGTIVLVNRQVEMLFGYSREELLGRPIEMLVPERFRGHHPAFRAGFAADPRIRAMGHGRDLFGLRKDGSEVPVEIGLNPIATDEGLFVISSIVDISARKNAELALRESEERLRQSQKMEAIGTLAGGIAHDFNNLLSAILGYGELVREQTKQTPAIRADMDELLQAAERGKRLVGRILAFSRRQELVRRPTSLPQVTQEAIDLLRSTLPSTIEIVRSLDANAQRVLADSTAIHQVIMNLATNAAHAMPRGGQLRIALTQHYVRDSEARNNPDLHEGPYNVLTVQDSGTGMDEETRVRAFEPFYTTKPPGTGTGLGLAMVHAVMHEHEGAIVLTSDPGKGTLVRCYFPTLQSEVSEQSTAEFDAPKGAGQRILYVDDEPSLARLGARRLELLNYVVAFNTDVSKALREFEQSPYGFDLVITDYTMPRMTGLDFSRAIKDRRPDIPIIMLSGYAEHIPPEHLAEAGISQLLLKPVSINDLGLAVHQLLGRTPPA